MVTKLTQSLRRRFRSISLRLSRFPSLSFGTASLQDRRFQESDAGGFSKRFGDSAPGVAFFCDAACMQVPRAHFRLADLLDEIVVPVVKAQPDGQLAAFHPKFVLIRFTGEKRDPVHRLVCMSRNLAASGAFDAVVILDGKFDRRPPKEQRTNSLASALQIVAQWSIRSGQAASAGALASELASTVRHVRWVPPAGFDTVALWPLGFGEEDTRSDPMQLAGGEDRMLVISPFLGSRRLQTLTPSLSTGSPRHVLVSNRDALENVGAKARSHFESIREFRSHAFVDPPDTDSAEAAQVLAGLHAKFYVAETRQTARWIVGSANATQSAINRNAELMIEMRTRRRANRIDALIGADGLEPLLVEVADILPTDDDPSKPEDRAAEDLLRVLAATGLRGLVTETSDEFFSVELVPTAPLPADLPSAHCEAQALHSPASAFVELKLDSASVAVLPDIARKDLSHFIRLRVTPENGDVLHRVLSVDLDGIDENELHEMWRADAIAGGGSPMDYIASFIDGSQYSADVVLPPEDEEDGPETPPPGENGDGDGPIALGGEPLLEKLLLLARRELAADAQGPSRMKELERTVATYADQLPHDFVAMWRTVYASFEAAR